MTTKSNKQIIMEFVGSTNKKDWEKALALLDDKVSRDSSTYVLEQISNKEDLLKFHKNEALTFPDLQETILFMVEEDGIVAARINFRGTQLGQMGAYPPSGKVLDADFNCFFKITNGKITKIWVEYDVLNGLVQLGHVRPPMN
ncbi:ester cyclase [Muricauda sp. ANG21]|uniref:ester cyclase n=1 Tax=Allomuricauda sp. ANG21 TaxID=3042468 RepID=UPI003454948B